MGKLIADNFIVVRVDVQEQGEKKALENAGGAEQLAAWHGSGLPFMVILDPKGKVLADTNLNGKDGSNIGYPAKPEEIAHFMKMMKSAPRLAGTEQVRMAAWLKEHAPK